MLQGPAIIEEETAAIFIPTGDSDTIQPDFTCLKLIQ